ncbi:hypothetical protein [Hyphomonas adhaerens]|uniref:hypothetical protein n=1 Tax=Hyphomonas adhaerens TaxID=81029 RepID=UPI002356D359|nr:hypothetical protein [Hyphomonas adhaerens]
MLLSEKEVQHMFQKALKRRRHEGGSTHRCDQKSNELDFERSIAPYLVHGLAGRYDATLLTHLIGAGIHQGPGTFCHDPIASQELLVREIRSALPNHFIHIVGYMDFVFWPTELKLETGTERLLHKPDSQNGGDGPNWANDEQSLFEVPHIHVLVHAFDEAGNSIPLSELKGCLAHLSNARKRLELDQRLISQSSVPSIRSELGYSDLGLVKKSGEVVSSAIDKYLNACADPLSLARRLFRGLMPYQGQINVLVHGTSLARRNQSVRTVPPSSTLGHIVAQRRRLFSAAGLECPNNGEPELIKEFSRRLRRSDRPLRLANGIVALR